MLELKNVIVRYGKAEVLKGISLKIEQGAIISLIGANGAGKTTCLKAISGLVPINSGEIWFNGKRIDGIAPENIARLGIAHIPEGRRLFNRLTVQRNLMSGAFSRKDPLGINESMQRIYEYFPVLERKQKQLANSLNGGEQQMLAFGRGYMSSAKLIILDEPSMGLAPILVNQLGDYIEKLATEGAAVILVEQNAVLALKLSNRAYVLASGKIILEGDSRELRGSEEVKKAYLGM